MLALVKDLREYWSAPTEEDIEVFETDTLAGFVLARSAAKLADATIRGDVGHLTSTTCTSTTIPGHTRVSRSAGLTG